MDLSIIIVNYKTKKLTLQCIESIVNQKTKLKFEIIVVDNSGEIRKSDKYTLITNKQNVGFAKANNIGIKSAKGKYILLLNSDTIVTKGAIDKMYEFARSRKDAGAVGPKLLNPDGTIQPSAYRFPTLLNNIYAYWFGKRQLIEKYSPEGKEPSQVDVLVMAAFLITPQTLKRVGLLNEKYFMYFEDFDYCREINRTGLKTYFLPAVEIIHLHGASGKKLAKDDDQWRRLIPSSKIYHGTLMHYLIFLTGWTRRQWDKVFSITN